MKKLVQHSFQQYKCSMNTEWLEHVMRGNRNNTIRSILKWKQKEKISRKMQIDVVIGFLKAKVQDQELWRDVMRVAKILKEL